MMYTILALKMLRAKEFFYLIDQTVKNYILSVDSYIIEGIERVM